MDKICSFRTLIYASNVTVLLIVSVTTDYWEYRGFDMASLNQSLRHSNSCRIFSPRDTRTYMEVLVTHQSEHEVRFSAVSQFYSPPVFLSYVNNVSLLVNASLSMPSNNRVTWMVLYTQYGNLFRDCDALEGGVRERLGITAKQGYRCLNYISSARDSVHQPALNNIHTLELAAFSFGVCSLLSMCCSLLFGIYGNLRKEERYLIMASFAALSSGISLIIAIALFHGKCYLFRKAEFLRGLDFPNKSLVSQHRYYTYGWSFALAWICIGLLLIMAWLWLNKAQYINDPEARQRRKARHQLRRQRYKAFIKGQIEYFNYE